MNAWGRLNRIEHTLQFRGLSFFWCAVVTVMHDFVWRNRPDLYPQAPHSEYRDNECFQASYQKILPFGCV